MGSKVSAIQVTAYLPEDELTATYYMYVNGTAVDDGVASSDLAMAGYGETVTVLIDLTVEGYISSTYTIHVTRGNKGGLGAGYIALIVIAGLVVLALLAYAAYAAYAMYKARSSVSDSYQEVPHQAPG